MPDPTLEDIARETEAIRASWTPTQRARRCVGSKFAALGITVVRTTDLAASISEELGKEASCWEFLTDRESRRKEKVKTITTVEEDPESIEFEADVVQFGLPVSRPM